MKQSKINRNKDKNLEPIKTFPTRKVERGNGETFYYFKTPGDTVSPRFVYASEFSNYSGVWMAIVQKENNSSFQFMNIYGELSDQEFKSLADKQVYTMLRGRITFNGQEIRPKRLQDDDGFYFILPNGTQTRRFDWATEFDDTYWTNLSIVKVNNMYRVLNLKGVLSECHYRGRIETAKMIERNLIKFSESALITETPDETKSSEEFNENTLS